MIPLLWACWTARQTEVSSWAVQVPGTEGYQLGEEPDWWSGASYGADQTVGSGVDTLDERGYRELAVKAAPQPGGRPAMLTVEAEVVDANRQAVVSTNVVRLGPESASGLPELLPLLTLSGVDQSVELPEAFYLLGLAHYQLGNDAQARLPGCR